ncbi:MAG: hypothetical protein KBC64_07960, partial [Simkaniaceae bacterium]|nr:hypothetical protein [Simkaniaceae bacterium]
SPAGQSALVMHVGFSGAQRSWSLQTKPGGQGRRGASQAKYWFIHSSSQQDFNEPRNKFSRLRTNGAIFESDLIDLEELTPILELLRKMYKEGNGIGKDLKSMSEDEQIRLATILSLREKGQGFNLADNRFTRELKLGCQNVDSDGFCFFRAIAKQIMDRELNVTRHPSLTQLPTTMEEILEKVAVYFNEHSQELMDQIFPPPIRQNFGTGDRSEELYQEALREYNDTDERQRRLNGFRDNFYEYVNLGRYDTGGQLLNAADWLPQVMSNILQIDIDIYDGQRPGGGFRTNNGYGQQRIGLGRINNNHYISLNGNLEAAWLVEQNSVNLPSQESGVAHDHVRQKSQKQPEKKMENEGIPEQRVINDIERRDMSHPFKFTEYVRHAGRYARDNPLKTATIVAVAAGAYSYKSKKGCAIL